MSGSKNLAIRLGALCYMAWGVMHVWVSWTIWQLGTKQTPGFVQGRLFQDATFMLFFSIAIFVVAILYTFPGKRIGYWLDLLLVSFADMVWIWLFIAPGLVGGLRGWAGPILWIAGAVLTTYGFFLAPGRKSPQTVG